MDISAIKTRPYNKSVDDLVNLNKWPGCVIKGDTVTIPQAENIILRTDGFLTSNDDYAGGNNHKWNTSSLRVLGGLPLPDEIGENYVAMCRASQLVREEIGFVSTEFVHNTWASSCYIGGPYGWCSPMGHIDFCANLGKYPSLDDVYNDLSAIAQAFPYVKMVVSLYAKETCEEDNSVLVTLVVRGGDVAVAEESIDLGIGSGAGSDLVLELLSNPTREQGLPNSWIREAGYITKPIWKRHYTQIVKDLND